MKCAHCGKPVKVSREKHIWFEEGGKRDYYHVRCWVAITPCKNCGGDVDPRRPKTWKLYGKGVVVHRDCDYAENKISGASVAKGAGAGAALGATVGSAVPGVGTAVGAGVGAAAGGAAAALKGYRGKKEENPTSGKRMYSIYYFDPDDPRGQRERTWYFNTWKAAMKWHEELRLFWEQDPIQIPIRIKATRGGTDIYNLGTGRERWDAHVRLEEGDIHIDIFDSKIKDPGKAWIGGEIFPNTKEGKQKATEYLKGNQFPVAIGDSYWGDDNPMTRAEARQTISRLRAGQKIKPPYDWFYRVRPAIRAQYPGRSKEDIDMITAGVWHKYPEETQVGIVRRLAPGELEENRRAWTCPKGHRGYWHIILGQGVCPTCKRQYPPGDPIGYPTIIGAEENPIGWSMQGTYPTKEEAQQVTDSFSAEGHEAMKFYHPIRQTWEVYVKRSPREREPSPTAAFFSENPTLPDEILPDDLPDPPMAYTSADIPKAKFQKLLKSGEYQLYTQVDVMMGSYVTYLKGIHRLNATGVYAIIHHDAPISNPSKTDARAEAERIRGRGRRARVMKVGRHDYQVFVDGARISRPVAKIKVKRMVKVKKKGKKRVRVGEAPTQIVVQSPEKRDIAVVEVPPLPPREEKAVVQEVAEAVLEGTAKAEERAPPEATTVSEGDLAQEIVAALKKLAPAE